MASSAEIRATRPDCAAARRRLAAADKFAESANLEGLHPEAAYVLCYDATRNALAAVLSALGKRVGEGRGAHALTIREAGKALGPAHRRAIIAIEAARVARNRTEYDAQPVTQAQLGRSRTRWAKPDSRPCLPHHAMPVKRSCSRVSARPGISQPSGPNSGRILNISSSKPGISPRPPV